ncbi:MAG: TonB-dependent receptor [Verrucomicrobia bacterium]|nr:TonB-dependent receptor [Verrucomicrobiota bacterium]
MSSTVSLFFRGGCALLFAWFFPLLASGQASGGTVTGQVSNAATQSYLEGAVVQLVGTNQTTTTDREGRFQFNGVPAGATTLAVSFTGLDSKRIPVSVASGQRVVQDVELTSEIYKLDKFVVAGEREGTAKAETLQRMAPNVKAIVSSDTFGNVADGNVGDMLQHMAGMTAEYNGPDVRSVSVRGVGSSLNSVTMDGQQLATSQSAGSGRQFEMEQVSLGNIETIEVTKAPTPDMDGASIGGSVNLVTKSAFDRAGGRLITFGFGVTTQPGYMGPAAKWKQPINGYGPSANLTYQDIVGEKRNIGITLTGTFHSAPVGGALIGSAYERRATPGPVYNWSTQRLMVNGATRSRMASGLKLDYRFSDQTIVSLNMSANFFHENNDNLTTTLATVGVASAAVPNPLATVDANGNRTGGGFINPNYANGITRIYPGGPLIASGGNSMLMSTNDKSGRTYLFSPQVRHKSDDMLIVYSLSYSDSATYYDISHKNDKHRSHPKGDITYNLPNIGWTVDHSKDNIFPLLTQTEGPSMFDLKNYGSLRLSQTDRRGFDKVLGAKFDLKRNLRLSVPAYFKTGFTYQRQNRHLWQNPRRYDFTGPDGVLGTADDNVGLEQFAYPEHKVTTDENKWFRDPKSGTLPPWMNAYGVARHQALYPELWKEDISFTSGKLSQDFKIKEQVAAAYVMGNVKFGPLSVLGGVRVEDTKDDGEGPLTRITPAEAARRAAWVGPVTDPEQRRRLLEQFGGRDHNKGQYRFYLPGVHLKYEPIPGLVSRLSWSTGVGRAPFGSIIPNTNVNDNAQTITVSNPELKPQYSNNWDLTAEYYFKPQGMVSVGVFQKKIQDYIATDNSQFVGSGQDNGHDGQYVGYRITTQRNSGYAVIKGIEASYQQQLVFLPGWAKGLGVYANVTKLKTHGENSNFTTGPTSSAGGTIAGFLDVTGNLGLGYRGHGFDLRLQAVYRGEYLTSNSTNAALVTYQVAKTTWGWKSRYNFSKNTGIFLDVDNLFSVPLDERYAAYRDRITSWRTFHAKIVGGITGRF